MRYFVTLALVCLACVPATGQSWVDAYFKRVAQQQAKQPHWATPLFTTTPRLDQRIRYDFLWQRQSSGELSENIGNGKGVGFIPARNIEVIIGIPPYFVHGNSSRPDGWGDETFQMKYCFAAANEQHGNYIVSAFFAASSRRERTTMAPRTRYLRLLSRPGRAGELSMYSLRREFSFLPNKARSWDNR